MEDDKMKFIDSYLDGENENENDSIENIRFNRGDVLIENDGLIEETIDRKLILEDGRQLLRD